MVKSLYIHIPYCFSKCNYCDFFSTVCSKVPDSYVSALCNEIKFRLQKYSATELDTIYIGGGTPSILSEFQLNKILNAIKDCVAISPTSEVTIEVNPDDVSVEKLNVYKKTFINRISCGIQSLDNDVLAYCNRRADLEANLSALNCLSENWEGNVSFDIISGLPNETMSTFVNNLDKIISYSPDHISMYSLTIESNTPFGKMLDEGIMEYDFDFSDNMWLKGYEVLKQAGYAQYEVSNFSKPGKESLHNLKYWNHCDYLGCGSGATGTVYNIDGSGERWTNSKNLEKYIDFWNGKFTLENIPQDIENISLEDSKFEFFMMGLRKRSGITDSEYRNIFNEPIPESVVSVLKRWNKNHLLDIKEYSNDIRYSLNESGILYLNRLLQELL